ncbi:MAG: protein kinase domain-containing protein [Acidobacteriota bacterium]
MSLMAGARVGPYEIVAPLGAGGMGEVYRARDTKLDRDVALKILPELFASDAERLARFEREAKTLAALNHPHIAQIYGLEQSSTISALVMELVEGEDLAARTARGPVPVDEALAIARQIAEALEAAHEQGIIHRDLKPANIKVRTDGTVKVLDFGLAKTGATGAGAADSPTFAVAATQMGMIVGTAAYMAPEQAWGKPVDTRADIWAFGCVLYEMLTGVRAFAGETVTDLLAAVVQRDPDWTALPADTPPHVRRLLRRCLEKDPKRRLRDIGDARVELEDALAADTASSSAAGSPPIAPPLWRARLGAAAVASLLAGIAVAGAAWWLAPRVPEPLRVQFDLPTPPSQSTNQIAVSPRGTDVVTRALSGTNNMLWLASFARGSGQLLPGTEGAAWPFWSADGRSIGFFAGGELKRVDLTGSPPQTLARAANGHGGAWSQDGVIVFAPDANGPLVRVSAAGGEPTPLTELDTARGEIAHRHPSFLPDGRHVIYVAVKRVSADSTIVLASLESPSGRPVARSQYRAAFAAPDRLLFMRESTLLAQPFDTRRLEPVGDPYPVADGIGIFDLYSAAAFSVSNNGVLVYRPDAVAGRASSVRWFDRRGASTAAIEATAGYEDLALASDQQRLVVQRDPGPGTTSDLWLVDLARGTSTRFTFDAAEDETPIWSPDGASVVFRSNRASGIYDLYQKRANGIEPEELLHQSAHHKRPQSWSPDGTLLLYLESAPDTGNDVWVFSPSRPRTWMRRGSRSR